MTPTRFEETVLRIAEEGVTAGLKVPDPILTGEYSYSKDDTIFKSWALFRRNEMTPETAASAMCRFSPYYQGPGRPFGDIPIVRCSNSYVLITQRRGWDV